jgi:hypothetical protein
MQMQVCFANYPKLYEKKQQSDGTISSQDRNNDLNGRVMGHPEARRRHRQQQQLNNEQTTAMS